jgi:hypothetical protein
LENWLGCHEVCNSDDNQTSNVSTILYITVTEPESEQQKAGPFSPAQKTT